MIAALPMYDLAWNRAATDRFWQAVADAFGPGAPPRLTRDADLWSLWMSPDLFLAQTCGLPFRSRLKGRVTLVATPDYGVEGCPPGYYCSVVLARAGWGAGRRLAVDEGGSQSGWAAACAHADARGETFDDIVLTGSHAASAAAVADGAADLAFVDAVTWRLLTRSGTAPAGLTVVDRTAPTPGLPYITAAGADPAPLRAALARAIPGLDDRDRHALGLKGLADIPATDYFAVALPPPVPAEAARLP